MISQVHTIQRCFEETEEWRREREAVDCGEFPGAYREWRRRLGSRTIITVVLEKRAHRIQGILRENQVVLLCIYNVNDPAHMVKTFGNTHIICALRTKTTVIEAAALGRLRPKW